MCTHVARFYADAYPVAEVVDFFAVGLEAGDSCFALLTAQHRLAVEGSMRSRGIVLESVAYVAVDSDEAWSKMQVNGTLDLGKASALLAPLMIPPCNGKNARVRVVGDMASMLCAAGKTEDAVTFEGLMHRLTQEYGASTICAYPIKKHLAYDGFWGLMRLSAQHAAIEFPQQLWAHHLVPDELGGRS